MIFSREWLESNYPVYLKTLDERVKGRVTGVKFLGFKGLIDKPEDTINAIQTEIIFTAHNCSHPY
mgnify:CR=1 FL=1